MNNCSHCVHITLYMTVIRNKAQGSSDLPSVFVLLILDSIHGHHKTVLNCHVMCHQPSSMWCNAVTVIVIVIIVHFIAAITCEQLMAEEQTS